MFPSEVPDKSAADCCERPQGMVDITDEKIGKRQLVGSTYGGSASKLLLTLEQLLAIEATSLDSALGQASTLIAEALDSEKSDIFLYHPATDSLVARGTSNAPMGLRQQQLGLDHEPLTNGGRAVWVF